MKKCIITTSIGVLLFIAGWYVGNGMFNNQPISSSTENGLGGQKPPVEDKISSASQQVMKRAEDTPYTDTLQVPKLQNQ